MHFSFWRELRNGKAYRSIPASDVQRQRVFLDFQILNQHRGSFIDVFWAEQSECAIESHIKAFDLSIDDYVFSRR